MKKPVKMPKKPGGKVPNGNSAAPMGKFGAGKVVDKGGKR